MEAVTFLGKVSWSAGNARPLTEMSAGILNDVFVGPVAPDLWSSTTNRPILWAVEKAGDG